MKLRILLAAWLVVAAVAQVARAHSEGSQPPPSIHVGATSSASGTPDQAEIEIGVTTQADTAEAAAGGNAERLDAVLTAMRKVLPREAEIMTAQYSVDPAYRYEERRSPVIEGYTASNVVRVKTGDLKAVNKAIDAAMAAGANNIRSLRFSVKDDQALRARALREAVEQARAEADVIASALGLRVIRVLSVQSEQAPPPRPVMHGRVMAMEAQAPPTPIEPGTIDVEVSVSLTVEIGE